MSKSLSRLATTWKSHRCHRLPKCLQTHISLYQLRVLRTSTRLLHRESQVCRRMGTVSISRSSSVPPSESKLNRPLSRFTIPTGPTLRATLPLGPRSLPFPMQSVATPVHEAPGAHVGRYRRPLPRSTPSRGSVGRYSDSVGRYPRTPSQWLRWGSVGHYPESVGRCPFLPRRLVIASTSVSESDTA